MCRASREAVTLGQTPLLSSSLSPDLSKSPPESCNPNISSFSSCSTCWSDTCSSASSCPTVRAASELSTCPMTALSQVSTPWCPADLVIAVSSRVSWQLQLGGSDGRPPAAELQLRQRWETGGNSTRDVRLYLSEDGEGGVQWTSLEAVLPSVLTAARELGMFSWQILVADTQCNSTTGPLTAVEMVYKQKPNLFLGPVCPYVLSPVSRFSTVWSIPVFTTSGMNAAFRDKRSEYSLLTCLAGDYQQAATFISQILGRSSLQLYQHFLSSKLASQMPDKKCFNFEMKFEDQSEQGNSLGTTQPSSTTTTASPAPSPSTRSGPAWADTETQTYPTSLLILTPSTGQLHPPLEAKLSTHPS